MKRSDFGAAFWGGYVRSHALDLLDKSFTMVVDTVDGPISTSHELALDRVSSFEFKDEHVNRWERIEVTEARIEEGPEATPTEEWVLWMNLWDVAQLTVRCAVIRVDGELLE